MKRKTNEEIARLTNHLDGIANIRAINKILKAQDESNLFPILNRFNATDRAIQRARRIRKDMPCYGLEYVYLVDKIISEIVNDF